MSECVVRMEKPSKDRMCGVVFDFCGVWYCPVAKRICHHPDNMVIPSWCPIICQLPKGHGRLGDLDELLNLMFYYDDYYGAKEAHDLDLIHRDSICYAIENAPTIVPAEAERSEE